MQAFKLRSFKTLSPQLKKFLIVFTLVLSLGVVTVVHLASTGVYAHGMSESKRDFSDTQSRWFRRFNRSHRPLGKTIHKQGENHKEKTRPEPTPDSHESEPTHTVQPTSSPNPTPASTMNTASHLHMTETTPGQIARGGLGVGQGHGTEVGLNLDMLNQLKSRAEAGEFDRECTSEEHNNTVWHTLVNIQAGCHFNHHHGDDPNYVNDIFGEPGAWFDQAGQSISYPWQTFSLAADTSRSQALSQTGTPETMENHLKHEGYYWVVRRDRPCQAGKACVTDYRVQFHGMFFSHGASVRWHSASIEAKLCQNPNDQSTCGISREGGWFDFGMLSNANTNSPHAAANESALTSQVIKLAVDNQFGGLDTEGLNDEVRHHPVLSSQTISSGPNTTNSSGKAEWWAHGGLDSRFQVRVQDPIGNVMETQPGSGQLQTHFHCDQNQDNCPWNQSLISLELDYVYNINSYFLNGDTRVADQPKGEVYVNRFGGRNNSCNSVSVDCIPAIYENVTLNLPEDGSQAPYWARYTDDGCTSCKLVDHDLTPTGRPSWISWFYRYQQH